MASHWATECNPSMPALEDVQFTTLQLERIAAAISKLETRLDAADWQGFATQVPSPRPEPYPPDELSLYTVTQPPFHPYQPPPPPYTWPQANSSYWYPSSYGDQPEVQHTQPAYQQPYPSTDYRDPSPTYWEMPRQHHNQPRKPTCWDPPAQCQVLSVAPPCYSVDGYQDRPTEYHPLRGLNQYGQPALAAHQPALFQQHDLQNSNYVGPSSTTYQQTHHTMLGQPTCRDQPIQQQPLGPQQFDQPPAHRVSCWEPSLTASVSVNQPHQHYQHPRPDRPHPQQRSSSGWSLTRHCLSAAPPPADVVPPLNLQFVSSASETMTNLLPDQAPVSAISTPMLSSCFLSFGPVSACDEAGTISLTNKSVVQGRAEQTISQSEPSIISAPQSLQKAHKDVEVVKLSSKSMAGDLNFITMNEKSKKDQVLGGESNRLQFKSTKGHSEAMDHRSSTLDADARLIPPRIRLFEDELRLNIEEVVTNGGAYLYAFVGDEGACAIPKGLKEFPFSYLDWHASDVASMIHRSTSFDADTRLIPPRIDTLYLGICGREDKIPVLALNYHFPKDPPLVSFVVDEEGRCSTSRCVFDPGGDSSAKLLFATLFVVSWFPP